MRAAASAKGLRVHHWPLRAARLLSLYHYVRCGAAPEKIAALAGLAFAGSYERSEVKRWLKVFFQRFFDQQFKRTTLPAGPKVGTVSLSPRGDWRMPDEAEASRLIAAIDRLP